MNALFFAVIIGTQAPVGFTYQDAACLYAEEKRGRVFQWGQKSGIIGCYAIENGCERAERDSQRRGIPMMEVVCELEEERRAVWRVSPAAPPPSPKAEGKP